MNITQFVPPSCIFLFSQSYSVVQLLKGLIRALCLFSLFPPLLVTVCPCNVRGNCKMAAKQLEGMPTIQSAVGILLGTFAVIGKTSLNASATLLRLKKLQYELQQM